MKTKIGDKIGHRYSERCCCEFCDTLWIAVMMGDIKLTPKPKVGK